MKKVKVAEATGPVLDWMVAKCEGPNSVASAYLDDNDQLRYLDEAFWSTWEPSTNWAQGGPIIERERIMLIPEPNGRLWTGCIGDTDAGGKAVYAHTPLIAAMRCFAAAKLGDEVEVPEELG